MTNYKIISDTIAELEAVADPAEFEYSGMNYWPVVRSLVGRAFMRPERRRKTLRRRHLVGRSGIPQLAGRHRLHRAASEAFRNLQRSVCETIGPVHAEVLFFTLGFEYQWGVGGWYNRFFDPLKELLDPAGVCHADIRGEFEGCRREPRLHAATDICPCIRAANSLALAFFLSGGVSLAGYANFRDRAVARDSRLENLPSEEDLRSRLDSVAAYTWMFRALLMKVRPSLGILTCYYHDLGMAFLRACRAATVVSMELQHSYVNELDWNWLRWRTPLVASKTPLPEFFGAWDERTRKLFDERRPAGAFMPVVVGNLWLEKRRAELASQPAGAHGTDRPIRVLYTAPGLCEVPPAALLQAIERSPPEMEWLVRLHYKTEPETARRIEKAFAATGGRVAFRPHGAFDLYKLFLECDAHITETSTTALEATWFGLRSIIIGDDGLGWFGGDIRDGALLYAESSSDIIDKVRMAADEKRSGVRAMSRSSGSHAASEVKALCARRGAAAAQSEDALAAEFDSFLSAHYGRRDCGGGVPVVGAAAVNAFFGVVHAGQWTDRIRRMSDPEG